MGFLADIFAKVVEWFLTKFVVREVTEVVEDFADKGTAKADGKELSDAKTSEEQAKALEDIASHTFPPGSGGNQ